MNRWKAAYDAALDAAKAEHSRNVARNRLLLARSFAVFLVELEKVFPKSGDIAEESLADVSVKLRDLFARYSFELETAVRAAVDAAIFGAIEGHKNGTADASRLAGVAVDAGIYVGLSGAIVAVIGRRRPETLVGTIGMVRNQSTSARRGVDDFIRRNKGKPYRDAAREVLTWMSRDVDVQNAINDLGARGEAVRRSIVRQGRARTQMNAASKAFYSNAKAIYVHEQNSMFHESDTLASHKSPIVGILDWFTSEGHPTYPSTPDICDALEQLDLHGFGPGKYLPATCPSLPHPHCEDKTKKVYRDPKDWNKPKPKPVEPRKAKKKEVKRLMKKLSRKESPRLTKKRLRAIHRSLNTKTAVAHDAFIDF